jgi:hypothetical protein
MLAFTLLGCLLITARARTFRQFAPALGLLCSIFTLIFVNITSMSLHPMTVDDTLYRWDKALGLDPLIFGRYVCTHAWSFFLARMSYDVLPFMFAIAYVVERSNLLLKTSMVAPILAWSVGYNAFPASGPAYSFFLYPWTNTTLLHHAGPRNCFPSMHLSWALLIALNAESRAMKLAAWIFVVLTVFATMGLGEHYFVDLIAAVPFCFVVQWAVKRFGARSSQPQLAALPATGDCISQSS